MKPIRLFLIAFLIISSSGQSFGVMQEESKIEYSVQILISHKHLNATDKKFKGVSDVREEVINGVYKYTTGKAMSFSEAAEIKTKMNQLGFTDAFVVKYKDAQRAQVESAPSAKAEEPKAELPKVVVMEEQGKPAPAKDEVVNQVAGNGENSQMTKTKKEKPTVGSTITQVDAQFPGGQDSLRNFMSMNKHYPAQPLERAASSVLVGFTVEYSGKKKNIKVVSGINKECDAEALRLVRMMPDWKPATINGAAISKEVLLPVSFYQGVKVK